MASCFGYIYIIRINTQLLLHFFVRPNIYNTSSYETIVTLNLYIANGNLYEAEAFLSCSGHLSFQNRLEYY